MSQPSDDPTPQAYVPERPSKTQRKQKAHDLQDLGVALVEMPDNRLVDLPMDEILLDALTLLSGGGAAAGAAAGAPLPPPQQQQPSFASSVPSSASSAAMSLFAPGSEVAQAGALLPATAP